ncbi:MAG: hypothetical protein ACLQJ7_14930 [Syntrophobacteraceae bacterium]
MKKVLTACLTMVFVLTVALCAFAQPPDRDAIKKRVDEIVTAINSGKSAADFKSAEKYYVFIMKTDGTIIFHKYIGEGKNFKSRYGEAAFKAVSKADANGIWVMYEAYPRWNYYAYVRKTKNGLIVGRPY